EFRPEPAASLLRQTRYDCFRCFLCVLTNKRKKNNLALRHYFSVLLFYDANMTLNPRQSALVELVRTQGSATIEALARHFDVTLQTVRRDVNLLSEAGMLSRFHGGVRIESSTIENIAYRKRQGLHAEAKQRVARAVAQAVPDGCSLILNIGTTAEAIARALLRHR